jgi:hypothetical protein
MRILGFMYLVFLFLCIGGTVYPRGKTEAATEKIPQNSEWVLAVTALDVSALPPSRQLMGSVMTRNLMESLKAVGTRARITEEYAYYGDYAWSKDRADAAKKLAAKREERDLLLYQGDPEWKYRKRLTPIDEEIKILEAAFAETESAIPLIVMNPAFKFTEDNTKGTFPPPPKAGGEYRFCVAQKADAFLVGKASEFYGRTYLSIRVYTLYSRSFQYEDSVIFSTEDTAQSMDALAGRLVAAVSGANPATILVHAKPEDAVILIDGSFAGQGETGVIAHPPGSIEIESFANNHEAVSVPVELNPGELAELYINLRPLSLASLSITGSEKKGAPISGASIYRGALYIGETPLSLDVPVNSYEYYHLETPGGETASVVFRATEGPGATGNSLVLKTHTPPPAGSKPVEKSRNRFYGAYGRFWVTLPVAFVLQGIVTAQISAYNALEAPPEDLYDKTMRNYYISMGAWIVVGVVSAEVIVRTVVYLYNARKETPRLVKSTSPVPQ